MYSSHGYSMCEPEPINNVKYVKSICYGALIFMKVRKSFGQCIESSVNSEFLCILILYHKKQDLSLINNYSKFCSFSSLNFWKNGAESVKDLLLPVKILNGKFFKNRSRIRLSFFHLTKL
jgi:hypothetical protein